MRTKLCEVWLYMVRMCMCTCVLCIRLTLWLLGLWLSYAVSCCVVVVSSCLRFVLCGAFDLLLLVPASTCCPLLFTCLVFGSVLCCFVLLCVWCVCLCC